MKTSDEAYWRLRALVEESRSAPLSKEEQDLLSDFCKKPADAEQLIAILERTAGQPPSTEVDSGGASIGIREVGLMALIVVPCLALTGLWGWFTPFTADSPAAIELLIIVLAVVCLILTLAIDIAVRHFVACVVLAATMVVLASATLFGWSAQDVFGNAFGHPVSIWVAGAVVAAVTSVGEWMNRIGQAVFSEYWEKGESRWREKRYARAMGLFVFSAFFLLFALLWPFRTSGSPSSTR